MSIKQTISRFVLPFIAMFAIPVVATASFIAQPVFGETKCGGVTTSIIKCDQAGGKSGALQDSGIWGILLIAIQILTAGVGVAALGGIVYGIVLYTTSGSDPAGLKKALEIIRNVVIGVVCYAVMWSALNWLIPGGIFAP